MPEEFSNGAINEMGDRAEEYQRLADATAAHGAERQGVYDAAARPETDPTAEAANLEAFVNGTNSGDVNEARVTPAVEQTEVELRNKRGVEPTADELARVQQARENFNHLS